MQHIDESQVTNNTEYFERIFRYYSRDLYFIALGLSNDSEMARDAVQEAFIYLWEHRSDLKPGYPIHNYLRTIVKNNILNHIRKRNIYRKHEQQIIFETLENTRSVEPDLNDKIIAVRRLIDSLPENCRKAFVMAVIEGMSYAKTASILGVSVNTIKSQIRIAYRKVRESTAKS